MTYSLAVRCRVFSMLEQGLATHVVAGAVGVSMRSIESWRAEVGGMCGCSAEISSRFLSRAERYEIARLHEAGHGVREIARRLGRSASTISRELRRPHAGTGVGYQPEACHQGAIRARARPRATKLALNPVLAAWVQDRLDEKNSPEQITGRLRVEFGDRAEMRISHETIYQAIYVRSRGELRHQLRRELRAHLRTGRTTRKPRNTRQPQQPQGRAGAIVDPVSIHQRPEEIELRQVPGHYEGDLMVGPLGTKAAIGTLVERLSGHITAFHLPHERTTTATMTALTKALTTTGWPMRTLTWDRGSEMAAHAQFSIATGIQIYFADPHAPWQRGTNENTNGLLREYFPKGLDLATITTTELQAAVDQLNNRPRKRHGFHTPNEVLTDILTKDQQQGVATTP